MRPTVSALEQLVTALRSAGQGAAPDPNEWVTMDQLKQELGRSEQVVRRWLRKLDPPPERRRYDNHVYFRMRNGRP